MGRGKAPKRMHFVTGNRPLQIRQGVRVGDEFEVTVRDLSGTGNAVSVHSSGTVVFVRGLWFGETARVRVKEVKRHYAEADIVQLLEPSPSRIKPPCSRHGTVADACGGCPWMFVDYPAQLRAKQARVEAAIKRLDSQAAPDTILPSAQRLSYRNRAQLKSDGEKVGFVANNQHSIVDIEVCSVLDVGVQTILAKLRQRLPNSGWRPSGKQPWITLDIDRYEGVDRISVNKRLPFRQVNSLQNEAMLNWLAAQLATLPKNIKVVELFCGSGNLTRVLSAAGFEQIVAAEVVPDAVGRLQEQGLPGVTVELCDLFEESSFVKFWQDHADAEVLVLDPPRDGLKITAGMLRRKAALRDILYISCDLATLGRDLKFIMENGFVLSKVQPLDMFPQTPHIEVMVHLKRL